MFRPVSSSNNVSAARMQASGLDKDEPINEISPALVKTVADLVYARLLADLTIDRERRRRFGPTRHHSGGWR
jgi:hypothetical protein